MVTEVSPLVVHFLHFWSAVESTLEFSELPLLMWQPSFSVTQALPCHSVWYYTAQESWSKCYSATCILKLTFQDLVNGFSCVCTTGWDGDRCQFERDECTLQLCQNGATCTVRQQVLHKYRKLLYSSFCNHYHKHLIVSSYTVSRWF